MNKHAIAILSEVLEKIEQYSYGYDWYWNSTDNLGQIIQVVNKISSVELHQQLWKEKPEYIQVGWKKIIDQYMLDNISFPLNYYLDNLLIYFSYDEIMNIAYATDPEYSYQSYISLLRGLIEQHLVTV